MSSDRTSTAIWWIRRDLRLTDNPALHSALAAAEEVIPLFILDPKLLDSSYVGSRRIAFMFDGLRAIDEDLRDRGSRLIVRRGVPAEVLQKFALETGACAIYAQQDYSPYAKARDARAEGDVRITYTGGLAIREPGSVLKADGDPYTVFTPYKKMWLSFPSITRGDILPAPKFISTPSNIDSLKIPSETVGPKAIVQAGEAAAKARLRDFVSGSSPKIYAYKADRDRPDLDGTSLLSPALRFGMLSPRLAALAAFEAVDNADTTEDRKGADTWLSELIWRDFYIGILGQFEHVRSGSFRPVYDQIQWRNDPDDFDAWCAGQTGYPFVDAAMRQLAEIGWMHNRARMVVASFLVKDLLIDWRWGERWFMQQLLDGDPASNNGGWQWSAGTGTDAAPYFRIFNPTLQSIKFDPDGKYIHKWVPELRNVTGKKLHEPSKLSAADQKEAGCTIGEDYPNQIVNHSWARDRTLEAYKAVKG